MRHKKYKFCISCRTRYAQTDDNFPRTSRGISFLDRCHECQAKYLAVIAARDIKRAIASAAAAERSRARTASARMATFQKYVSNVVSGKACDSRLRETAGYSASDLRRHLERQFSAGMIWGNYAGNLEWKTPKRSWHIDHIIPKSRFAVDDIASAFALHNLRPLWSRDNLRKGAVRVLLI